MKQNFAMTVVLQLSICLLAMSTSMMVVRCVLYIFIVSNHFKVLTVNTLVRFIMPKH